MESSSNRFFSMKTLQLMRCPKCPIDIDQNDIYRCQSNSHLLPDSIIQLSCCKCSTRWYYCSTCVNMRKHMVNTQQLGRHIKKYHPTKSNYTLSQQENIHVEKCTLPRRNSPLLVQQTYQSFEFPTEPHDVHTDMNIFSTNEQNIYHKWNRKCLGNNYLVGKAHFDNNLEDIIKLIDVQDVTMNLDIASFLGTLSRHQQKKFANIIDAVKTNFLERDCKDLVSTSAGEAWKYTNVPTSYQGMRKTYLEGKNALLPNVPCPFATKLDENHSYLSIRDMISHFLALNVPLHEMWSNNNYEKRTIKSDSSIYNSKAVMEIMKKVENIYNRHSVLVLIGIEFSDDFDPNNSIKSNRQSVWMKSLTISPLTDKMHSMITTYPISFGLKNSNHQIVEEKMNIELFGLSSPQQNNLFYHKQSDSMVRVHFELLLSLQDQPERRSCSGLMLGGGTYSARWGYSCNFMEIKKKLVSCEGCLQKLLANQVIHNCTKCTNWDIVPGERVVLEYDPPHNYPDQSSFLNVKQKIVPFKLTFKLLREQVELAQTQLNNNIWNRANVEAYLRTFCINKDSIDKLIVKCDTKVDWDVPCSWRRNVFLHQHVDVIMHLVFLGIVKKVIIQIQQWTQIRLQYTSFLKYMEGILESLKKFNLSWLHILNYQGGKLPGWVSENYIGMSRVFKWVYSYLDCVAQDSVYHEPLKDFNTWNGATCQKWLKAHGLDHSGSTAEVKVRVQHYMTLTDGPPPIQGPRGGSVINIINVVKSMHAMISHIMSDSINNKFEDSMERHIKIFLTYFETMDSEIRDEKRLIGYHHITLCVY